MQRSSSKLVVRGAVLVAATGLGGLAFTASNTVPTSKAGDGAGAVSGYVLSSVHYALDASDPSQADAVEFELDSIPPVGSTIKAKVAGSWYGCSNSGTEVSCETTSPQVSVESITTLQVVIAD